MRNRKSTTILQYRMILFCIHYSSLDHKHIGMELFSIIFAFSGSVWWIVYLAQDRKIVGWRYATAKIIINLKIPSCFNHGDGGL